MVSIWPGDRNTESAEVTGGGRANLRSVKVKNVAPSEEMWGLNTREPGVVILLSLE